MLRVGTWRAFRGTTIAEAIQSACGVVRSDRDVDCVIVNGQVIPKRMLPAGIPSEWVSEAAARMKGAWVR